MKVASRTGVTKNTWKKSQWWKVCKLKNRVTKCQWIWQTWLIFWCSDDQLGCVTICGPSITTTYIYHIQQAISVTSKMSIQIHMLLIALAFYLHVYVLLVLPTCMYIILLCLILLYIEQLCGPCSVLVKFKEVWSLLMSAHKKKLILILLKLQSWVHDLSVCVSETEVFFLTYSLTAEQY